VSVATPPQRPKRDLKKFASTRGGSVAIAAVMALLAGGLLLIFLTQYRNSVNNGDKLSTVLVAQRLIEKGSSGDVIATQGLYQTSRVPKNQLKDGALADPGAIRGKVATQDILPGQQLTAADFARSTDPIVSNLAGAQRAISVPLDSAHGMIGDVHTGDRVDVIVGFNWQPNGAASATPVTKVLLQGVLVLQAPVSARRTGVSTGGGSTQNVVIQVPADMAAQIAFSSDNGKIWLVKRAKAGAKNANDGIVSLQNVLFGTKPIQTPAAARALGGH
jgi:Flp pilus assembly protein CpaB